ncbi:MAG: type II toxin-antitoxin system death-on-curing family toxin [Rhodocyclaceae bacterium]|nr:type II toxin-antitoxin system death-on-curing family toxin [Rhodocyclaceae bacterium]
MTTFAWIEEPVVWAIHEAQLAEHSGSAGVRDAGLLASALARPINLAAYGAPDVADCAAAYGYGVSRNHPFIDGNKRTAFVCVELFLAMNGHDLKATDADCVLTMLAVAVGEMDESAFAAWLRANTVSRV